MFEYVLEKLSQNMEQENLRSYLIYFKINIFHFSILLEFRWIQLNRRSTKILLFSIHGTIAPTLHQIPLFCTLLSWFVPPSNQMLPVSLHSNLFLICFVLTRIFDYGNAIFH